MKNHLGETMYNSFPSWKRACRKVDPNCIFIGTGLVYAVADDDTHIGEYDGVIGVVYLPPVVSRAK
jgi:hypothetical protein